MIEDANVNERESESNDVRVERRIVVQQLTKANVKTRSERMRIIS